jgi:alkaline phosphatase D
MLAYKAMRETVVWLQTSHPAKVELCYHTGKAVPDTLHTYTTAAEYNTAKFFIKGLEPGTTYSYSLLVDGVPASLKYATFSTQKLWQHREDPPSFSVALGSCAYTNEPQYDRPGKGYGVGNNIFTQIEAKKPNAMLWLGDNIYLREVDYDSEYGINARYSHYRRVPELQGLLQCTNHYAIWDDHDFGPNDGDRSFVLKEHSLAAFKRFWGNYHYGINGQPGITTSFTFNDAEFFLLDNRYYRSPNNRVTGERYIIGEEQLQWLVDALKTSSATFKFVAIGGQFLNEAAVYENHATYAQERSTLLNLIEKENIKNVVFLTGDRHRTELHKLEFANGNVVYDLTCSPLTSTAYEMRNEENPLRMEGTMVPTQNFGILNFSGSLEKRTLKMQIFDAEGKLKWEKEITRQL